MIPTYSNWTVDQVADSGRLSTVSQVCSPSFLHPPTSPSCYNWLQFHALAGNACRSIVSSKIWSRILNFFRISRETRQRWNIFNFRAQFRHDGEQIASWVASLRHWFVGHVISRGESRGKYEVRSGNRSHSGCCWSWVGVLLEWAGLSTRIQIAGVVHICCGRARFKVSRKQIL